MQPMYASSFAANLCLECQSWLHNIKCQPPRIHKKGQLLLNENVSTQYSVKIKTKINHILMIYYQIYDFPNMLNGKDSQNVMSF